ncbi:hypothetical protein PHLGIDRAFT_504934 [Phlebiopsis gigantea 11061_1 CR5-6]|uniref:Origin recognition complex subunit 5 n=1 Tax=Phlebiopsis gigantea (strain 11061_1 CR5-6) TaxID=745531 RepID=A0A0C3NVH6_PHLG1|nr:hypothetical protein PHLGIDRAFT_504934 [Phlebiopsis gigantea 11061_1 CR5-6]
MDRAVIHAAPSDGYANLGYELSELVASYPPPFVYVHDPHTTRIATTTVVSTLSTLRENGANIAFAHVNAVACFTPRLLYDTALNAFAGWSPSWEDGCANWIGPLEGTSQRFNESFDGFTHGIRAAMVERLSDLRLVLVIEDAQRLKENMPDILAPLTRLYELSHVDITTIFVSEVCWEHIRPSYGASHDPYYLDVAPSSKQEFYTPDDDSEIPLDPYTYHPVFRQLYTHFLSTTYSVCSPFTTGLDDLSYIAAATWPAFIRPVIDEHRRVAMELKEAHQDDPDAVPDSEGEEEKPLHTIVTFSAPTEDARIRLTRLFTPSITAALEALYPRQTNAITWANANIPAADLLSMHPHEIPQSLAKKVAGDVDGERALRELPRIAKFVLIAAYLASTNPARTDMRMFGRGPDARSKRRRKGGSPRKTSAKASAVKIPQRLLGPMPFPLDRMVAILGILLEENDADTRLSAPEYKVPGEYTEIEISRVGIYAQVMELASVHLLHRTSPSDRLEMSPTYKCGISYDIAFQLAKDVGIRLNDVIWDPVA